MINGMSYEVSLLGFSSYILHLHFLAMWLYENYLTFQSLSFFNWKIGLIKTTVLLWRWNKILHGSYFQGEQDNDEEDSDDDHDTSDGTMIVP